MTYIDHNWSIKLFKTLFIYDFPFILFLIINKHKNEIIEYKLKKIINYDSHIISISIN